MKLSRLLLGAAILAASVMTSFAQDKTPMIDQRAQNQKERIDQGVKSGQLTRGEASRLRAQQRRIKRQMMKAKADGKVTAKERAKLKRKQLHASQNIHRKKHNARKRN